MSILFLGQSVTGNFKSNSDGLYAVDLLENTFIFYDKRKCLKIKNSTIILS